MRSKAEIMQDLRGLRDRCADEAVRAFMDEVIDKVGRDRAKIRPLSSHPQKSVQVIRLRRRIPEDW